MASILDVARLAKVSKSTVSRVIRGNGPVDPDTKSRVQAAMDKLDYSPHYFAQGMRGASTRSIGVLIPDFANPFYHAVFKGIDEMTRQHGYLNMVCITGEDADNELTCARELLARKVAGLIYFTYDQNPAVIDFMVKTAKTTPVIFMDPVLHDQPVCSVVSNGFEGSRKATTYLLAKGCRRIGYIRGPTRHWVTRERLQGYERALEEAAVELDRDSVVEGDFHMRSGFEGARQLMSRQQKPDAIMAATDVMAIGALRYLLQAGLRVPEDVSVVGFDNIELTRLVEPSLTTVAQPVMDLGRNAARLIIANERNKRQPERLMLDCELIIRASTDARQPRFAPL